jgi:hypothetical protein
MNASQGDSSFPRLFEPITLAGKRLKNRVTHASMTTRMGREQRLTERQLDYYRNRARGGCSLIVTEPLTAWRRQQAPHKLRVRGGDAFADLQRFADAVESEDCRLLGQIRIPAAGGTSAAETRSPGARPRCRTT